jgi:glycerophosphoryl diester phosphodiesterase
LGRAERRYAEASLADSSREAKLMASFKKIAHRGASGHYPENTRLAFAKAIELGVDMIELDCQMTQDGHIVVFHDERLNRTAGTRGTIRKKRLEQLKKLDIGRWRKKDFAGERILTLEEALNTIDGNVDLCLEIKTFADALPGIELKILFIVSHYDYLDRTIFSSFNYPTLFRVRELAPEASLGLIVGSATKENPLDNARRLAARSLHVQKEIASREFLMRAWDEGLDIYVWTVNEIGEMEALVSMGVQGLISDFPERFGKLRSW